MRRGGSRPGFAALLIGFALAGFPLASEEPRAVAPPPLPPLRLSDRIGHGIGPPGGEVRTLAMAPADPDLLYAGTSGGHVFTSEDGAGSWRESRPPIPQDALLGRIAVHPERPETLFATFWRPGGGGGLLRSADAGVSWERVQSVGNPPLRAIAISPSDADTMYVGGPLGVWRTSDGGATWGAGAPLREIESLAVDPRSPLRVFAGTWRQAYRSVDGGGSWERLAQGMELDRDVFTIALAPGSPDTLYAGTCGWLYSSLDGGGRWSVRNRGIPSDHRRIHSISPDPTRPCTLWAGTRGGLYRSTDCGTSFALEVGGISVSAVITDPSGGKVFAGTEERGILARRGTSTFMESNSGLNASKVEAFDASADMGLIAVACTGRPGIQIIHATRDGGRTWTPLVGGREFEGVRHLRTLDLPEPRVLVVTEKAGWWELPLAAAARRVSAPPGRLASLRWAGGHRVLLAATDHGLFALRGGDFRSSGAGGGTGAKPGGESPWVRIRSGRFLALSVEGNRYMALGSGIVARGLFSELAEGKGPEAFSTAGLPGPVVDVALGASEGSHSFSITQDRLFRSVDFGVTWAPVALPWPAKDLRRVVADATRPGRAAVLDAYGAVLFGGGDSEAWRVLGYDPWLRPAQDIALSPVESGLALVGTVGHGLRVVSLDGISYGPEDLAFARPGSGE